MCNISFKVVQHIVQNVLMTLQIPLKGKHLLIMCPPLPSPALLNNCCYLCHALLLAFVLLLASMEKQNQILWITFAIIKYHITMRFYLVKMNMEGHIQNVKLGKCMTDKANAWFLFINKKNNNYIYYYYLLLLLLFHCYLNEKEIVLRFILKEIIKNSHISNFGNKL